MALSTVQWLLMILLLIFPILWQSSHTFRYYVKVILFNIGVMTTATLSIPYSLLKPRNIRNVRFVQWMCNVWQPAFGVTVEIRNEENLCADKPRVIICNHQNTIDLIGMMAVMPPRTIALVKKELMYAGPFGIASWLSGLVFVDRSNRNKAHEVMEATAQIMRKKNANIWIYPEGTRNLDGNLLPFKKGAFHLAIQAKVPICPIVFSSYGSFLNEKDKIFNKGKVIVSCLPPIPTDGLTAEDVNDLTERARDAMKAVYESTSQEAARSLLEQTKLAQAS